MKVYFPPFPEDRNEERGPLEVEVHDYDLWNADHTIAVLVYNVLKKFQEDWQKEKFIGGVLQDFYRSVGCPLKQEDIDYVVSLNGMDISEYDIDHHYGGTFSTIAYNQIMKEIIYCFELIATEHERDSPDTLEERIKEDERIKRGLQLFGNYFRSFWN